MWAIDHSHRCALQNRQSIERVKRMHKRNKRVGQKNHEKRQKNIRSSKNPKTQTEDAIDRFITDVLVAVRCPGHLTLSQSALTYVFGLFQQR